MTGCGEDTFKGELRDCTLGRRRRVTEGKMVVRCGGCKRNNMREWKAVEITVLKRRVRRQLIREEAVGYTVQRSVEVGS